MQSFRGTEGDVGHANGVIKKASLAEGCSLKRITTSSFYRLVLLVMTTMGFYRLPITDYRLSIR